MRISFPRRAVVRLPLVTSVANAYDRVEFDFSLDEAVVLQMDFVRTTREGRSWRKREQRTFVMAVVAVAAIIITLKMHSSDPARLAAFLVAITLLAFMLAVPFGWYYDYQVQTRTARLLTERMGAEPYHCSIEIHSDALRVTQSGLGFVFPWSSAVGTDDASEGILVTFTTGRVLARARGFISLEHRQHFLRRLRELVPVAHTANELGGAS